MIGVLLDQRYRITEFLSEGAFGKTFLAEDTKLPTNPICVIKQFKPKQSQPEFLIKAKELFDRLCFTHKYEKTSENRYCSERSTREK